MRHAVRSGALRVVASMRAQRARETSDMRHAPDRQSRATAGNKLTRFSRRSMSSTSAPAAAHNGVGTSPSRDAVVLDKIYLRRIPSAYNLRTNNDSKNMSSTTRFWGMALECVAQSLCSSET